MSADLRIEVRTTGGSKVGDMRILDPRWLTRNRVCFVRALDVRHYGAGHIHAARLEAPSHEDLSMSTIELAVSQWATPPSIGKHGTYRPGRIDFCLIWDGPVEALRAVREFEAQADRLRECGSTRMACAQELADTLSALGMNPACPECLAKGLQWCQHPLLSALGPPTLDLCVSCDEPAIRTAPDDTRRCATHGPPGGENEEAQEWQRLYDSARRGETAALNRAQVAEAALSALGGRPETGWQPIDERTPRDVRVLLFNGYAQVQKWGDFCIYNAPKFTHWQPLPSPPLQEQP